MLTCKRKVIYYKWKKIMGLGDKRNQKNNCGYYFIIANIDI